MSSDNSPIGVFDSGLGGLSVLKVLAKRFPSEEFLYLGDTARLPYGSKSPETIQQYTVQNLKWLASRNCKVLIIACNTASSHFHKNEFQGIPVYDVIAPGSKMALQTSKTKVIGVLGTRATIQSQSYVKKIHEYDPKAKVIVQSCPMFVPLVEEDWNDDPITNLIVFRYIQSLRNQDDDEMMDSLVLGCTHYPFLRESIQKAVGQNIQLIESGEALAAKLNEDIKNNRWKINPQSGGEEKQALIRLASTDRSDFFENLARKLLSPFAPQEFELVNL
ncbi:MAG: glutamate racemase [Bdellovibrionota bacterium]